MASREKAVWATDPDTGEKHELQGPQLAVYREFIDNGVAPGLAAVLAWSLESHDYGGLPRVRLGNVLVTTGDAHTVVGCSRALLQRKSNLRDLPSWWRSFYMRNGDRRVPVWWTGRLRALRLEKPSK